MVQDLQRLELGPIVLFRHSQPELSKYALVGVVGGARRLVSSTLKEVHRVLLRAGIKFKVHGSVIKQAISNIRSTRNTASSAGI